MTTGAIVLHRLLRLPVAIEARSVACRDSLECSFIFRHERHFSSANGNPHSRTCVRHVTGRAVVQHLRGRVVERFESGIDETPTSSIAYRFLPIARNHALMQGVREVAGELAGYCLFILLRKRVHVTRGQAWGGTRVADRANRRSCPFEKLWTMTANATVVIRIAFNAWLRRSGDCIGSLCPTRIIIFLQRTTELLPASLLFINSLDGRNGVRDFPGDKVVFLATLFYCIKSHRYSLHFSWLIDLDWTRFPN
jgi:hypothetical protein